MALTQKSRPDSARRIVIKIGSAVIAPQGVLDPASVRRLAAQVTAVRSADPGRQVVIVSSGAIASGFRALGLERPPKRIADKQAAAAVGQPRLMAAWAEAFAGCGGPGVGQVLLTGDDIDHRARFLNARHTLERLLAGGVVPIVNENDSVSFEEIKLGDNDRLSALVASLVGADLLLILSSVEGVLNRGSGPSGRGAVVPVIESLSDGLSHVTAERSATGVGGMATKVGAACEAASLGTPVVVAGGALEGVIERVLAGEPVGTYFPAQPRSRSARARWIGYGGRPRGVIVVDNGAASALSERAASLLPSGILRVEGEFGVGAVVELRGPDGEPVARGLSSYSSEDLRKLRGRKAAEIEGVLGYRYSDEAVHRDDLVLLRAAARSGGTEA